ncbi:protein FAM107B isoform X1 [Malaya genurostris]|uniref:protein FAM107B isoform X1 n=2 Tax=Malaya genurostris TaxID=325434 RepID=UPI0026F3C286|nr:protein FAM107B isoform X1 [Malaya genurostris]XP_058443551.1 protein FAM107B isoform X1 [Malaya genurostris]XP_058443552.1 protein FAM107B isoform X1 [Malaya genurostris]XP_058443553.1 protein FAM107B isoform X1 [Malaya genurostris]XP_058443554.1 protein FAM107B isoform X1 [Malaya genurostris]XP_058443555.1 protein FAM107B isoform X1 [Malaya genurostris]
MFRPQLNPTERIREKMRLFEQDASLEGSGQQRRRYSDQTELLAGGDYFEHPNPMMPPINHSATPGIMTDAQGLIVPKKLINPCSESMDRQNLHRELMFNQKMGKSVLNQKTELQRALEKQKERQVLAAQNLAKQQAQENSIANELGRVIMQRAARLEQKSLAAAAAGSQQDQPDSINPEYLNARAKLRATTAVYSK